MMNRRYSFDPRAMTWLLIVVNLIGFANENLLIEAVMIVYMIVMMSFSGLYKTCVKLMMIYFGILFFQYMILPYDLPIFITIFAMLSAYVRKLIPSLMVGTIMIKRIPLSAFIAAMRRYRLSEKLILTLTVTIRYFPSILQEGRHIRDAIKMRQIKGIKRFEAYMIPLMISAINTSDDLSAAALTRGVDSPLRKTSYFELKLTLIDFITIFAGVLLIVSVVI